MEKKIQFSEVLKKYTMVLVLVVVVVLFTINTEGRMVLPQNVNNLIAQNAYVFILATGCCLYFRIRKYRPVSRFCCLFLCQQ